MTTVLPTSSTQEGHRACLVTRDRKLTKAVVRTLVPQSIMVDHFNDLAVDNIDLSEYSFILVDGDQANLEKIQSNLAAAGADQRRVIVFSRSREKEHVAQLLGQQNLTNFIAMNGGIREEELLITMNKLKTGNFFGLVQYLTRGTTPVQKILHSPQERGPALSELCTFLANCLVSSRFVELARCAADELLMNALGRASAAASAQAASSTDTIHPVEFQYACDGRLVGVSVSDSYGSLTGERLLTFLERCFRMEEYSIPTDTSGAGLGLYVALNSADQFVVNIAQGVRTEVICLLDIRGHLRDFEGRSKSFHMFITENESCLTT